MATNKHGPEVVERFENGRTVRDVRAAVTYLTGTAPVHVVHANAETRAKYINTDIIIRTKEDAVAAFGAFASGAGYTIPQALFAAFNKDRGKGIGTYIVRNVFDPETHKVNNAPDPAAVTAADIIGGMHVDGKPYGLEAAAYTYSKFGYFPRRIIAPGFSPVLSVRQKMLAMANILHGHAIADLPLGLTMQQAVEARGVNGAFQLGDPRMVYCWPAVKALDAATSTQTLQPYSQHLAAVWNEVVAREEGDDDGGPSASPSNRAMIDVSALEVDLKFLPGRMDDADDLLDAGIVTANMGQYGAGIVSWGPFASSRPASTDVTNWLHIRAMYDVLHEAIIHYLLPFTDRRGLPQRVDMIEEQVQKYLNIKERDGWIYGARFRFNRQKNTPEEILGVGRFWYRIDGAPIGIMHRITVENYIDMNLVKSALGLAGSTSN